MSKFKYYIKFKILGLTANGISWTRGNAIIYSFRFKQWYYKDDLKKLNNNPLKEKKCVKCGKFPTVEGYDTCLGYISGVNFACCGHGITINQKINIFKKHMMERN